MTAARSAGLKVLHVTVEMAPLVKLGGLGDVLGSLPKSLVENGVDARAVIPAYRGVLDAVRENGFKCRKLVHGVHAAIDCRVWSASVYEADVRGVTVYILEQPDLYSDRDVYPESLLRDDMLPFVFLSYAALELPSVIGWEPDIYHVHDWSAAILPIALKWHRHYSGISDRYDVVFSIHNLAHQGIVDPAMLPSWGLAQEAFTLDGMEFYGQANIIKGAAFASDAIVTVSQHYSWDIQTLDGGFGLHGVFSRLRSRLFGILNGIDKGIYSPETDPAIAANYSADDMAGKAVCRAAFMKEAGWEDDGRPILLFVGRLVGQKGVDIMLRMFEDRLGSGAFRAAVIGSGAHEYEAWTRYLIDTFPDAFWCSTEFSEARAHRAYAAADILVMPSLFEPCGLSQMIAMAYGTVPVVRNTGGLADTVIDFDGSPDGTGFIFSDYSGDELSRAVDRALAAFADKTRWHSVAGNAMRADFSWALSTKEYISIYDGLKNGALPQN